MRLIFATNNNHKISEIKAILGEKFQPYIFTMSDIGIKVNPEENGKTFLENAFIKSNSLYIEMKNKNLLKEDDFIIADDTGLCIKHFDDAPGIYSSRFMGSISQEEKNNKILDLMKDLEDSERYAYFITKIVVIEVGRVTEDPKILDFEGKIEGYIAKKIEKTDGFGYDPIFAVGDFTDIYKNKVKTFSNLGINEKNKISHRAKALLKFVEYLEKNHNI